MYSSLQVADYLLELAENEGSYIQRMKLIKLVYICHGWMLGLYKKPLVTEPIEAWRFGPVIAVLYDTIKKFQSIPVRGPLAQEKAELSEQVQGLIHRVYKKYKKYSGKQLSEMTHMPGTPWSRVRRHAIIPNRLIGAYYEFRSKGGRLYP